MTRMPSSSLVRVAPGAKSTPPKETTTSRSPTPSLALLRGLDPSALMPRSRPREGHDVADGAVDDDALPAVLLRARPDEVAHEGRLQGAAAVDDEDLARAVLGERRLDQRVVAVAPDRRDDTLERRAPAVLAQLQRAGLEVLAVLVVEVGGRGDAHRPPLGALTASTGASDSSRMVCAALPMMSLPTGVRRRSPMTMSSALVSSATRSSWSAGSVASTAWTTSCSTPDSSSFALDGVPVGARGVARVDEGVAAAGVEDDEAAAAQGRLLDRPVEGGAALRAGDEPHDDGHGHWPSWLAVGRPRPVRADRRRHHGCARTRRTIGGTTRTRRIDGVDDLGEPRVVEAGDVAVADLQRPAQLLLGRPGRGSRR